ncbi:cubilin-like [Haliotis asinina]|uniref:cubilin-like n=1 Tax=Haliotis asinina TaxID=109174 RepID=UPI0035325B32
MYSDARRKKDTDLPLGRVLPTLATVITLLCGMHTAGAACLHRLIALDSPQNFTSPGYPVKYPPNINCVWHIRAADPNKVVVLETLDSMIHINCKQDTAAVFQGESYETATRVRHWCGDLRYNFDASNSYFVFFRTDSKYENRGFQIRYYQGPSSGPYDLDLEATRNAQNLISPGYPVGYFRDMSCVYSIQAAQSSDRVQIDVVHMYIENSVSCQDDNITIIDPNVGKHDVGTICGQMKPSYQSTGNRLKISFRSNSIKQTKGFMIKYKSISNSDCGDEELIATDVDSYLLSPGYPSRYYSNLACRWTVSSSDPEGKIEVEVLHVEISGTPPTCNEDRLEVDYLRSSSQNEVICGSSTQTQTFVSIDNTVLITFTSDGANEGQGFDIRYRQVQVDKPSGSYDKTLAATETEQVLTSPGYPRISLIRQTCAFIIRAPIGYHVRVTLIDLDIELARVCRYDRLTITDGTSTLDELWCGRRAGEVVNSQKNYLTVTYTTDDSNNGQGFSLKYSAVRGSTSRVQTMTMPTRNTPLYLTSPGFEKRFPRGITYSYIFTADPQQQIRLRVTESYLRYNTANGRCLSKRVRLYDGPSSESSELKSINTGEYGWCALDLPVFISNSNYMTMVYETAYVSYHGRIGFVLMYEQGIFSDIYPHTCGGMYFATSEETAITSPNYPGNYGSKMFCKWTIWASSNTTQIRLGGNFSLVVGTSGNCDGDYLNVYDGAEEKSKLLSKLCGTDSDTLQSTGNLLTVVMKTDERSTGKGFRFLFYETTDILWCGSTLTASLKKSYLTKKVTPNTSCKWVFTKETNDTYIQLYVVDFELGRWNGNTCGTDYVEIFDGNSEDSKRIAVLCGYKSAALYVGTGSHMMVKMVTGASPRGKLFKIEYSSSSEERCTPKDRMAEEQPSYLLSPSYPNRYPPSLHCTWLIDSGSEDHAVMFKVVLASIISSEDCTDDYLAAYDGMSETTGVKLGEWCQDIDQSETKHSTQRYLTIVFHTNEDQSGDGFRLRYWRDVKPDEQDQTGPLGNNLGAVVGGIVGGLILLLVIIIIVICIIKRSLSKGSGASPGGGQATPAVVYLPSQQVMYERPPDYPPPQYDPQPVHQGSKYKVQGHGYPQTGPVQDHEVSQLLHVKETFSAKGQTRGMNIPSQDQWKRKNVPSQGLSSRMNVPSQGLSRGMNILSHSLTREMNILSQGADQRHEYSQSGPVEKEECSQSGPVQKDECSQSRPV